MSIINGKKLAKKIRKEAAARAAVFNEKTGRPVGLAVLLAGEDEASRIYVRNKEKDALKAGIKSEIIRMTADASQDDVMKAVDRLNRDPGIDGYIVQLPLPSHLDESRVIAAISPEKDVDGFTPYNLGKLLSGEDCFVPCTPQGCMHMIDSVGFELKGKNATVVGRSRIVGKPLSLLLLARHCTVTMCHSRTSDLAQEVGRADVVVAAVGVSELVKGEWIKPGAIVLDVGVNRGDDGKLVGDVEFEEAEKRAAWITPVPGGVGPMTRACLIANAVIAAEKHSM